MSPYIRTRKPVQTKTPSQAERSYIDTTAWTSQLSLLYTKAIGLWVAAIRP